MIDKIRNKNQYEQVHQLIEGFIKKATKGGGFNSLNKKDTEELHQLTLLAADYEKNSLKIWPLPITINDVIQILEAPLLQLSATLIRNNRKEGITIRYLVPEKVREEIENSNYFKD